MASSYYDSRSSMYYLLKYLLNANQVYVYDISSKNFGFMYVYPLAALSLHILTSIIQFPCVIALFGFPDKLQEAL